jgi:hypothetical protein
MSYPSLVVRLILRHRSPHLDVFLEPVDLAVFDLDLHRTSIA